MEERENEEKEQGTSRVEGVLRAESHIIYKTNSADLEAKERTNERQDRKASYDAVQQVRHGIKRWYKGHPKTSCMIFSHQQSRTREQGHNGET